jgi:glycosyltransferase involved in cell wall biosynthesis
MKIGFLGNTNNYPFTLAYALKRAGHDVIFYVDQSDALHRPESKYPEVAASYGDWIVEVPLLRPHDVLLRTPVVRALRARFSDRELLVLNGFGPAVFARSTIPTFVIVTGSDLDMYADKAFPQRVSYEHASALLRLVGTALKRNVYRKFVDLQRRGISRARLVEYSFPGLLPHGDRLLDELCVAERDRCWLLMTDTERIAFSPPPNNAVLRVFCMARLNWSGPWPAGIDSVLDNKRTDILLLGLAEYIRTSGLPIDVRMVKKGMHVPQTLELIDRLGLTSRIRWLDEMTHTQFCEEIAAADVVTDHFGQCVIGLSVRDALAVGRPTLVRETGEQFQRWLGESLPVVHAETPSDIAKQLRVLANDPALRRAIGEQARAFAERFCSPAAAARFLQRRFAAPDGA